MEKIDIRHYSDTELSLLIFNDITLYTIRHEPAFLGMIEDMYDYTHEQLCTLLEDLYSDKQENN